MLEGRVQEPSAEAEEYLQSLTSTEKRQGGLVYTPDHLVDFVLELVGYQPRRALQDLTLLDPACGAGAFLERAVGVLARHLQLNGINIRRGEGRDRFLGLVEANLYGIDIDEKACALARQTVRRTVGELAGAELPASFFRRNVLVADFLLSKDVEGLPRLGKGGFSVIVGNPPYVSATHIKPEYKSRLRSRFRTATGRLDLYTVFIERSLLLLPRGGRLAFLTPDKFLISETARTLRSFILLFAAVRKLAYFRSHRVFEEAATVPCITVLERGGKPADVLVLSCAQRLTPKGRVAVRTKQLFPHGKLTSSPWHVTEGHLLGLARRLQSGHATLAELTERISAGPATGLDNVYVVPPAEVSSIESELLRPVIRGRDLAPYRLQDPHRRVLIPYTLASGRPPALIDLAAFPGARAYLERHRRMLEQRHCVRVWQKEWYDLHDQVLIDLAAQLKILVPDVARHNRFALDEGRFFPLHSVYYILPKSDVDPYYLLGILNSRVTEFLIHLFAPTVKDGFKRYRRQFLARLPIPDGPRDVVELIAEAAKRGDAHEVDALIVKLFSLRDEDIRQIESFLTEARQGEAAEPRTLAGQDR